MFHKPFRVKSNSAIKGSDRKKLRSEIEKLYPGVSNDNLKEIIPNKEEMTIMKIYTHSGLNVLVYCLSKNPVLFDVDGTVYPTVYTLWKHPELLPVFTTWPPVFTKIKAGADLMLPGLVVKGQLSPAALGNLSKGHPCAVKLLGQKAPVAVGKTSLSSSDMFDSAMRGKGVLILHCYQDLLWAHGDKSNPPVIEDLEMLEASTENPTHEFAEEDEEHLENEIQESGANAFCDNVLLSCNTSEFSVCDNTHLCHTNTDISGELDDLTLKCDNGPTCGSEQAEAGPSVSNDLGNEECNGEIEKEKMDALLYQCFLQALKTNVKPKTDLPILTSKFFKAHLQVCCPPGESLDVKKSSYKKLTKFLAAMQKQEFIKVKELSKGVESIIEVYKDHPDVRGFVIPDHPAGPAFPADPSDTQKRPLVQITDLFMVSSVTALLFGQHRKGAALTAQAVRQAIIDYVTAEGLENANRKGFVTLGPVLSDVALNRGEYIEVLRLDDLTSRVIGKMNPAHQISLPGQKPIIKKGKIEPIIISVAQRGGNKKVTLVHNLETYGIEPSELAHDVQIGVACSTSVSPLPGKNKGLEVLVQGNQINFIAGLLDNKYGVHRKYMQGLEKAPKSGKKKK